MFDINAFFAVMCGGVLMWEFVGKRAAKAVEEASKPKKRNPREVRRTFYGEGGNPTSSIGGNERCLTSWKERYEIIYPAGTKVERFD